MCDLTRADTVAKLSYFKDYLYDFCPGIPVIMIGNKADLVEANHESLQQIESIAVNCKTQFKITSAKTALEVESTFFTLAQLVAIPHE